MPITNTRSSKTIKIEFFKYKKYDFYFKHPVFSFSETRSLKPFFSVLCKNTFSQYYKVNVKNNA